MNVHSWESLDSYYYMLQYFAWLYLRTILISYLLFVCFLVRVSLYSLGYPQTHSVDPAWPRTQRVTCPCFPRAGIKGTAPRGWTSQSQLNCLPWKWRKAGQWWCTLPSTLIASHGSVNLALMFPCLLTFIRTKKKWSWCLPHQDCEFPHPPKTEKPLSTTLLSGPTNQMPSLALVEIMKWNQERFPRTSGF